jgi:hypothetical protein
VAPVKVGGAANAGVGRLASAFDHGHPLVETDGPTDLSMGPILLDEMIRRVGPVLTGRQVEVRRLGAGVSTTSTAAVDVDPDLTFVLVGGRSYMFLWVAFYQTAAVTTGMLMGVNYNAGQTANPRYGLLMASGATAVFSAVAGANNTLLGQAGVGPGSSDRVALLGGIYRPSAAGSLAMRYATGVAASSVTMDTNSYVILMQL